MLFATFKNAANQALMKKVNYPLLFMKFYVYGSKLNNNSLTLSELTNKIKINYKIENLVN